MTFFDFSGNRMNWVIRPLGAMTDIITGSYFLWKKSNESGMRMQKRKVSAYLRARGGWLLVVISNFACALFLKSSFCRENHFCLLDVFRRNFVFNFQLKWSDKMSALAWNILLDILYVCFQDTALCLCCVQFFLGYMTNLSL